MTYPLPYAKDYLDTLYTTFDVAYLHSDPLKFLHKFDSQADKEIVGLLASCLAYGRVETIVKNIDVILSKMSYRPYYFTMSFKYPKDKETFHGFRHRFNSGDDIAYLIFLIKRVLVNYGSLKNLFLECYTKKNENIKNSLILFIDKILEGHLTGTDNEYRNNKGITYLLPTPAKKSACKRLNLFLRWMVRKDDSLDTGLWQDICPSKLIMPVDTHIARISQYIGLTKKKQISWCMAEEITQNLKLFDPKDPVKYDFSLSRLGILKRCTNIFDSAQCSSCPIKKICIYQQNKACNR